MIQTETTNELKREADIKLRNEARAEKLAAKLAVITVISIFVFTLLLIVFYEPVIH